MKYSLWDVFQILSEDEAQRGELIKTYESLNDDGRFHFESRIWRIFYEYRRALVNLRQEELFALRVVGDPHVKKTSITLQAEEEVDQDLRQIAKGEAHARREIQELREQLNKLISDEWYLNEGDLRGGQTAHPKTRIT